MVSLSNIMERREEVLRIAARHGADEVRIFGSVARGQAREHSDVDVLVRLAEGRSLLDQIALMQELEDLLGCTVDVVEDVALHQSIRQRVLAEAVAL